uniref:Uncharacterized protein n=1 Tax=Solanum tuberosum TaxID=4113 RepID=M1DER4_SOLTU
MKLHRINQEIRELEEREIELEFTTAVALAKSAALDVEIATKKIKFAIIDEEIVVTLRKEEEATLEIQRLRKKYPLLDKEAKVYVPEDTKPEVAEEEPEEKVIYMPPFQGRLKEGDQKITLQAYQRRHSVGGKVLSCAFIYEHLKALHILKPLKGPLSRLNLRTHIRHVPTTPTISCNQPEPLMTVPEHTLFYCHYFTHFKYTRWVIYYQLVYEEILTPTKTNVGMVNCFGGEILEAFPYHGTGDHNIEMCLVFRYDVESLIN